MRHFLLFYNFAPDYEARRDRYRNQHLARALAVGDSGHLVPAGALTDPVDTGVLLSRADSVDAAEDIARSDTHVLHDLVTGWRVREWITAVGDAAAAPVLAPTRERPSGNDGDRS